MSVVDEGVPDGAWRRVHPLTPLFSAGGVLFVFLFVTFFSNMQVAIDLIRSGWFSSLGVVMGILAVLGIVLLIAALVGGYGYLAWRRTMFAVTDDAVWYRHGIFFRNQRHARVDRIQSVEIYHPLLGRIVGVGKLRVEVAGSSGSSFSIEYLRTDELESVRHQILTRTAGVPATTVTSEEGPFPKQVEDETPLYKVPFGRLVGSVAFSPWVALAVVVTVVLFAFAIAAVSVGGSEMAWSLLPAIPGFFGALSVSLAGLSGSVNFRASIVPTGIRIKRGFANTSAETIPPRRIHAVEISQPLLWRLFGWYRVRFTQIGGTSNSEEKGSGDLLLPVGTIDQALLALWLVVPDLGVPNPNALLQAALRGSGPEQGFTVNPRISAVFDPLVYRRRGVCATPTCVIIRDGQLNRTVTVVPCARMQSVGWVQGPWQRNLRLASLGFHIVPGKITPRVKHLGTDDADRLMEFVVDRANAARMEEDPTHWLARAKDRLEADIA